MKKSTKSLFSDLQIGSARAAPRVQDLVDRVVVLAKMSPTDLAALLGTKPGAEVARLEIAGASDVAPDSYLRAWDSIGQADPGPLNDTEYNQFLLGDRPGDVVETKAGAIDIYGAHLDR